MISLRNFNYHFNTSVSTKSPCRYYKLSKTLILKRFYPGGINLGHAHKVLNALSNKVPTNTGATSTVTLSPSSNAPATVQELPFTEVSQSMTKAVPNETLYYNKMKELALKMIPSIRPKNYENTLDPKTSNLIQGKESLVAFLQYFEKLPEEYVKNQEFFIVYYKTLCEKHPEFIVRAFQLALEVYYNKRRFSEQEICNIFEHKFSLEDFAKFNKGITDTSTFFSALQTNYLLNQPGFSENVTSCVVVAPALDSSVLKNLPPDLITKMAEVKKATGNTINDINLDGHYYDFKITFDPYYGKNHIIFIDNNVTFQSLSTNILRTLQNNINILTKRDSSLMTVNEKALFDYYIKLKTVLTTTSYEQASDIDKLHRWNTFLFQDLHLRPHNAYMPLFIPLHKEKFQPHPQLTEQIEHIQLPAQKQLQAPHVTKAIMGVVNNWDLQVKKRAFQDTDGSLVTIEDLD